MDKAIKNLLFTGPERRILTVSAMQNMKDFPLFDKHQNPQECE